MDDNNRNLILAVALSMLVIMAWSYFAPPPEPVAPATQTAAADGAAAPAAGAVPGAEGTAAGTTPTTVETAAEAPRLPIDTARLSGSISLKGGRIDDLRLKDYRLTTDPASDIVTVLSPVGRDEFYYAVWGWAPGAGLTPADVPDANTVWGAEGNAKLGVEAPVTLVWDNGKGLTFRRKIAVDKDFLFTVTQSVENRTGTEVRLAPYGSVIRHGEPSDMKNFFILHEGAMLQTGETFNEVDYDDIRDYKADPAWGPTTEVTEIAANGWLGFTAHYWMTVLVPASDQSFKGVLRYSADLDTYEATARLATVAVAPGTTASSETRLFAGAKEWETIRQYETSPGIYNFIDSIDWGWFFYITKPMFWLLHTLNQMIGNMGWAIICLTLIIKALLFPLAYKSYVSMARMKELQPEMEKLKARAGDDRQMMQQEMMALYKKERVNPAAGCLPILLQIPVFFSLYKVIFVTLELRHAPWFGVFNDLSAPDPTSIWNLFGWLPWAAPEPNSILALIFIGVLPLLLGISMWLQQKLNPAPTDPTQAAVFAWMPWIFMFMLGGFASGLVVYWIANNTITFTQQYIIMRSHGHKPDLFGNIRKSLARKPKQG